MIDVDRELMRTRLDAAMKRPLWKLIGIRAYVFFWLRCKRHWLVTKWKRWRGIPLYIRCEYHKDFGGKCEGEATWAIEKTPDYPITCDDCRAREQKNGHPTAMVRLGRHEI